MDLFKFHRGLEADSAVEPLAVIKDFDVFEEGGPCLAEVGIAVVLDQLTFEGAPERLHVGVIIAVAGGAHAWGYLVRLEQGPEGTADVLAAAIGMVDEAPLRSAAD